jgi:hypothetical protein
MKKRLLWWLPLCFVVPIVTGGCATTMPLPQLTTEEFMVAARDPGLELYVRNKHQVGVDKFSGNKIVTQAHLGPAATFCPTT